MNERFVAVSTVTLFGLGYVHGCSSKARRDLVSRCNLC